MKKFNIYVVLLLISLLGFRCSDTEQFPPLPTNFEDDEIIDNPGEVVVVNLVKDNDFELADLDRKLSDDPILFDTWVIQNNYGDAFKFGTAYDFEQQTVAQMINATTTIPNADPKRAFIAQRIKGVVDNSLYTISFKGKSSAGAPTCRIFVKMTDAAGVVIDKYFIYDTEKPLTPTGKYFAYCKNCVLSPEWQEFKCDIDFTKTTTQAASIAYNTAEKSTATDRTNIVVCLQNNAANCTMQIDDVSLVKKVVE